MPYIPQDRRLEAERAPQTKGELTYTVTKLILWYLRSKGESFDSLSDVVAVLECAKLEFYARIVRPYEDAKEKENGDVY